MGFPLTLKPDGFYMRATLRAGITAISLQTMLTSSGDAVNSAVKDGVRRTATVLVEGLKPMIILYGSDTGTCMSLAQRLSVETRRHGYQASVTEMDAAVEAVPSDRPNVIVTASYEGQSPDNAGQFVSWLATLKQADLLQGTNYAVLGCGHSDWSNTYQRVPKIVNDLLQDHGARRVSPRGFADASRSDIFTDFDTWSEQIFWPMVAPSSFGGRHTGSEFQVEISTQARSSYLRQDVQAATVIGTRRLTAAGEPEKRHLEVNLPKGMTYEPGDYLAVLPLNPPGGVTRAMKLFGLPNDATITITPGAATFLPTGKDLESCRASISKSGIEEDIGTFIDKEGLAGLIKQRVSLLDLLTKCRSVEMPFATFISLLPPLRPRHYLISSSPLVDPRVCTVTYTIIDEAAKSGIGRYVGVTGAYLSSLNTGDEILVSVRTTNKFFHLPADPAIPLLMFGAGTGIAPFRGFIQDRSQQLAAGRPVAPALMFMGCRSAIRDRLYVDEVDAWCKAGAVDVRYAFSQEPDKSERCRYIQNRLLKDKQDVLRMWKDGAKVFTCGGPSVSEGVGIAAQQLFIEARLEEIGEKTTTSEAEQRFRQRRNERFVVDVFA